MKPIYFEGHNIVLGASQPQYQPLPACHVGDTSGTVISCWELEPNDKLILEKTGCIWLSQLTFNQPLQPQLPSAIRPAQLAALLGVEREKGMAAGGEILESCCTDDPQKCEGCRKPEEDSPDRFTTKDGGRVAMAGEGVIPMGVNPFGFVCADCGTYHSIRYSVVGKHGNEFLENRDVYPEDLLLDVEVTRNEEETIRYREHLGIPGTAQDVARELIAVDDMVLQALASVLPSEEKVEDSPEKRVAQLVTILGMHREVLANFRATMQHMVQGIAIARDAVHQELEHQRLISITGQSQGRRLAGDALSTMIPGDQKKEDAPRIVLTGGGRG